MVNCAVYGCSAHSRKSANDENVAEVGFFPIPKVITYQCARTKEVSTRRRAEWFSRINRKDMNRNAHHYRVCGKHFISGRPAYLMDESSPDWAPSLHLGHGREMNGNASSSRYTRKRRRAERSGSPLKQLHENANEESIAVADSPVPSEDDELSFDVGPDIQETPDQEGTDGGKADFSQVTDLTMEQIEHLENENRHLLSEVGEVRNKLNKQMLTEDCLTENEDMLQFYTGLPNFNILMALLEVLKDGMTHTSRNSLTLFQEMLIVLIRLRLNVPLQDLAYRFNVSQPTVSRVVNKWIDVAYVRLSRAVKWPGSKELQGTMPMAFRLCFRTQLAVILDCFEVFIERPSSLLPRSHTWSNYKHHNTVKYLIGIAPQGVVTFISRGWCGRSSDKVITEKCGVLNNLQPGDYVLADRGFTIGDSVGLHCAKLAIPAFTKGKPQLSACEVEKTRKLANLRIHVERVIGLLRNKYRMLKYTLPVEMLASEENGPTVLDKIVFVCAALCNLSNSTVPFG